MLLPGLSVCMEDADGDPGWNFGGTALRFTSSVGWSSDADEISIDFGGTEGCCGLSLLCATVQ